MELKYRQDLLIAGFLLLSLLLHLLLLLVPETGLMRSATQPQPVYVEMRPPQRRDRELDLPVKPVPPKPRETPAKRLGPQDQVVKRETAPPGQDSEDRPPRPPAPPSQPQPVQPRSPATAAPPVADLQLPPSPTGDRPAAVPSPAPAGTPSLEKLTTLTPTTMARLEKDWRRKLREGVEKGDTVWLDTEQDLLISFFRRFRANIYNVWNYPERARQREEQGQCLLRIVISRQGTVDSIELLQSSGSNDLDQEAIRAVRRGAPYGPLPAAYPHPRLNIMAYFRYTLSRVMIYGERP
jgi:protein TonB